MSCDACPPDILARWKTAGADIVGAVLLGVLGFKPHMLAPEKTKPLSALWRSGLTTQGQRICAHHALRNRTATSHSHAPWFRHSKIARARASVVPWLVVSRLDNGLTRNGRECLFS
ncbi:hypothetical protein F5B22DRAFT_642133 [Xylaria bambusicola]|uniref:uncharacterized protein n=1 Tax=Xylaria bambusicola TaxID=326684 RepID=UPI002008397A|nr:uncharacterized protein F5B22DRAFT_642133 [Xylaria bambusicola]KAI0525975.1 hypothetical protein F5B22DRAFT_642133 [Xylaria bambusicola]